MILLNLRTAMRRKEVEQYINASNYEERLRVYAVVLALILTMFNGAENVIDDPMGSNKKDLIKLYQHLEDVIICNSKETKRNKRIIELITSSNYQIKFEAQVKRAEIALSIIMLTLFLGVNNKKNNLVKSLWHLLLTAAGTPEDAIDYLIDFENETLAYLNTSDSGIYNQVNRQEWTDKFGYTPSFLHVENAYSNENNYRDSISKNPNKLVRCKVDSILQSLGYKLLDNNDQILCVWAQYTQNTDAENAILIAVYTMAKDIKAGKMGLEKRVQFATDHLKSLMLVIKQLYEKKLISKQCMEWSLNLFGVMLLKPEMLNPLIEEILESYPILKIDKPDLAESIIY